MSCLSPRPPPPPPPTSKAKRDDIIKNVPLYRALVKGELDRVIAILERHPNAIYADISIKKEKAIHIAVSHGHEKLVEELLMRMNATSVGYLRDDYKDTALHVAARGTGNRTIAKALVDKSEAAHLRCKNKNKNTPLTLAAVYGNKGLLEFLRQFTPDEADHYQRRFLHSFFNRDIAEKKIVSKEFIESENYDLALKLWEYQQNSADVVHAYLKENLHIMAKMVSVFSCENQLRYFKSWMYSCIDHVPQRRIARNMTDMENQHEGSSSSPLCSFKGFKDRVYSMGLHFMKGLVSNVAYAIGIKDEILKIKEKKIKARELLSKMCSPKWTFDDDFVEVYLEAIKLAIKCGNAEFVEEVLRSNPSLLWGDEKSGTIFHIALACRQEKIWNLIYGLTTQQRNKINEILVDSNNMLHVAACPMVMSEIIGVPDEKKMKEEQTSRKVFSKARDAAMKVQRELQWYKEVERMVPSSYKLVANKNGETPSDLFSNYHYNLVKEGEQWMRDTAGSFTIVATLIVTVMFAAAFTLPGGTNDDSGNPMFLQHNSFMIFIVSDAISLFSSVTAVLMFLSILTSRCTKEDFLKSLPKRLKIGLATLFLSIATMMVTFGATLVIVLGERIRWVAAPVTLLAIVPVTSFALLQFPMFFDMFSSTYGRGIFNRKTECSFFNNPNDYFPPSDVPIYN